MLLCTDVWNASPCPLIQHIMMEDMITPVGTINTTTRAAAYVAFTNSLACIHFTAAFRAVNEEWWGEVEKYFAPIMKKEQYFLSSCTGTRDCEMQENICTVPVEHEQCLLHITLVNQRKWLYY